MEKSMTRWRLILGQESQDRFSRMGGSEPQGSST